jgi:hypothetical protein
MRDEPSCAAERYGYVAEAACKDVEARKTKMAAPVNFSRWLAPALTPPLKA